VLETILQPDDTEERCGLILNDDSLVEIENTADDKTGSYHMRAEAVLPFLAAGMVKGTWHTHPNSDPTLSGEDYSGFLDWPGLVHSIVGRRDGAVVVTTYKVEDGLVIACD
jgi:proteasome lid subunit RPN8/RPN11